MEFDGCAQLLVVLVELGLGILPYCRCHGSVGPGWEDCVKCCHECGNDGGDVSHHG